ncbi:MAG: hypothetical protein ABWZ78_06155, partial [Burkholderiaceae bacterium]
RLIVERIDEVSSPAQVVEYLQAANPGATFDEADVRAFLDELVGYEMAATDGLHYVGLALMPGALRPTLETFSRRRQGSSSRVGRTIPIAVRAVFEDTAHA